MSAIVFLSDNLIETATSISLTTGTENAQFPLTNLEIDATVKKFRSQENSIVIEIDLGSTRPIDSVAVTGDATESFEITSMSIKTSLTTDFTGSTAIPVTLSSEFNIGYEFFTEVSHRFVEITLTGSGSFVEFSNLFIGKKIELTQQNLSLGSFRYQREDRTSIRQNKYGQKFIDRRNIVKTISGSIEFANQTEQETLDDMFLDRGESRPLWMIVDQNGAAMNDGEFKLAMYGYLERYPAWTANGGQLYSASIQVRQVV